VPLRLSEEESPEGREVRHPVTKQVADLAGA
jgi:hypothetical protein